MRLIGGGEKKAEPTLKKKIKKIKRLIKKQQKKKQLRVIVLVSSLKSMNKSQITGRSDSFNTWLSLGALINRQVCCFFFSFHSF